MAQRYRDGGTFMTSYVSDICGLPSSASSSYALPLGGVLSAAVDSRIWLVRSVWEDCASYAACGCCWSFRSRSAWASDSEMYDSEKMTSNCDAGQRQRPRVGNLVTRTWGYASRSSWMLKPGCRAPQSRRLANRTKLSRRIVRRWHRGLASDREPVVVLRRAWMMIQEQLGCTGVANVHSC